MKPWMMAMMFGRRRVLVTPPPFTANATVVIPAGVAQLETIVGKGAAGAPGGTYPDSTVTVGAASVQASNINGDGPFPAMTWEEVNSYVNSLRNSINAGGSGSDPTGYISYTSYVGDGTAYWNFSTVAWDDAVPGTATIIRSGWGTGFINVGANGSASVRYTRSGGSYGPTTGASATGFGKTFPGGVGGAATPVTYSNVPVTPGNYQLVVPPGGSITISYYV